MRVEECSELSRRRADDLYLQVFNETEQSLCPWSSVWWPANRSLCVYVCVCLCVGVGCALRRQLQNNTRGTFTSERWRWVSVRTPEMTRWISGATSCCYPLLSVWSRRGRHYSLCTPVWSLCVFCAANSDLNMSSLWQSDSLFLKLSESVLLVTYIYDILPSLFNR